tara:strand:- start:1486 stop:2310 length:825 start_codon:yes stop_codon:yes gene_type:complete
MDRMGMAADPDNGANLQSEAAPPQQMQFIVPTEIVELPTKGLFYDEGHPLHHVRTIEIKHMTTKEEDILTNESYIKNGTVLDRLLQSLIVDNNIRVKDLYVGDKNALLVASRIYGYGPEYKTNIICPACNASAQHHFNLHDLEHVPFEQNVIDNEVEIDYESKSFIMTIPRNGVKLELRLLKDKNETQKNKKTGLIDLYKRIIKSVNGNSNPTYIDQYIKSMAAVDSRYLRAKYFKLIPNIDFSADYECENCSNISKVEVPLNAEFFWPDPELY